MIETVYAADMHVEVPPSGIPIAALRVATDDGAMLYELVPYDEANDEGLVAVELIDNNNRSRGLYRLEAA